MLGAELAGRGETGQEWTDGHGPEENRYGNGRLLL